MHSEIIILAAGRGVRMGGGVKALRPLGGLPLLAHVLGCARAAGARRIHLVHGEGEDAALRRHCDLRGVNLVAQPQPLGTGHALMQALPAVKAEATVCVMPADAPLVRPATIRRLCGAAADGIAGLTVHNPDPGGYGRILRDKAGKITAIREARDADAGERAITEVNTGFIAAPAALLAELLPRISRDNAQGEFYLTDLIAAAANAGQGIADCTCDDPEEAAGANTVAELAALERKYQRRTAGDLMRAGVTIMDPARMDVRGELSAGDGCTIDVNVVTEGAVQLGSHVYLGPGVVLRESTVGDGSRILAHSVVDGAAIGSGVTIGPFARIRPGTTISDSATIGNFVEVKNSAVGPGAKASHLSYLGDSEVGEGANIGAGVVTCNYDGAGKHRTAIGAGAFIGSGAMLVAPVTVGAGATIGAGATVTKDAPPGKLTLTEKKQRTMDGWRRPAREGR
ncbi:MAG: bifunctional UDP-N-acetylglucosamine diphosphorylase/glucosamine-1-phosphate N-acetyltransferase GlmU [Gammaproteobacteria bacterium]|nr:bifunctional UDP-N-acetylglucosamine diphosphorylase/glucosamine-1-phosphate N-acetyltransferase GlmU [Gammaproteobacteria bacterium]